jgi:hypothetical protein
MRTVPPTVRTVPLASRARKAEPEYRRVDAKSGVGRLLRSCRWIRVLCCDGLLLHCDHVGVTTVAGYVGMFLHTRYTAHYTRTITMRKHRIHTFQVRSAAANLHTRSLHTRITLCPTHLAVASVPQLSLAAIYNLSVCEGKAMPWLRG